MYPITFLTSYLLLVFCHFSATEPPPHHGYGPPSPVEFGSNEVASHEQYNSPGDFPTYGSLSGGSPSSSYGGPSSGAYRKSSGIGSAHYSGGGFPESYKGSKGGVSSSYISIVHGGGGAGSASKSRPVAAYSSGKPSSSSSSWPYGGDRQANYGPVASFSDGKFGGSNAYEVSNFGHNSAAGSYSRGGGFGAASSSPYSSGFEYPSSGYHGGGGGGGSTADHNRGGYSEVGGGSDEVGSYSSGGPSYVAFNGAKANFGHSSFGGSRGGGGGNAYSTANVIFGGGSGGGSGGVRASHGNIHTPSFSGNFKPSATKAYKKYSSQNGGYSSGAISSANNFGAVNPLAGSESGYNSRALKSGYSVDAAAADDYNSGEDPNVFAGFGDGAGFKVQSSYSTG